MKFIGRQSELRTLEQEYRRDGGFVVIYGRRRVGKTRLIKEFIKDKPAVYFLATEEVEAQSMKRMAGVIARATGNALLGNVTFSDWADLFRAVATYRPEQKKVIVLDEFPYMVKTNPAFPSILQNIWDEFLQDSNIMLILSGSLIGMMKKHALSYDSPLYGRRTAQIRLMPLPFTAVYASQSLSFDQAVQQYALTGGVPKYLEFFTEQEPLIDQIRSIVLSKNGFLYEEPNFLLRDEVQTPINYFSIIRVIADGNHKLSKICGVLEQESSAVSPYLATLSELGFVVKDTPITEKNPEHSRKGLYFVSDNFTRFWFRYVYPYKGELELDNQQIVLDELQKTFISSFVAFAYEDICKNIFAELCRSGQLAFVPSRIGSYWHNDLNADTEIDVAAVDRQNKRLFIGECKYHQKPVDLPVLTALQQKVAASADLQNSFIRQGYQALYGLFSKSGFSDRLLAFSKECDDLLLINEDQIIQL